MSAEWYPGIRAFCSYWSHAPMLQQTFQTLEREFVADNDACIDAAKGLVECACRIIIDGLDDPLNPQKPANADVPICVLVGIVIKLLKLGDIRHRGFADLVKFHNGLTDSLRVLRNDAGNVSHGKDGFIAKLSTHHRRSAILAADAIVTFLHEAYLEIEPDPSKSLEPYERFAISNESIDAFSSISSAEAEDGLLHVMVSLPGDDEISLVIEPSRLLFGVDREAYKFALSACREAEAAA